MKKKHVTVAGLILIILIVLIVFFIKRPQPPPPLPEVGQGQNEKPKRPCPGETKTLVNKDPLMKGILAVDQKYKVIENYYDCNPHNRGDLVYFPIASSPEPVVRRIVATAGDTIKLSRDKETQTWNLLVNDEVVKSVVDPNRNYFFGAQSPATLSLYAGKGPLKGNEIVLFAAVPPGDNDSGLFGLFSISDALGKVEPLNETETAPAFAAPTQAPTQAPTPAPTPAPASKSKTKAVKKPKATPTPAPETE